MIETATAKKVAHVCVYCSSSTRVDPAYFAAARETGRLIGARGHALVWGSAKLGLMGAVADHARAAGARLIGVIPDAFNHEAVAYPDPDELIVTPNIRDRKRVLDERADGFLVLPGGFGTLEELAEMLQQHQLGHSHKPIVLLNTGGFYDPLLTLFDHFVEHRFAKPGHLDSLIVATQPAEALEKLEAAMGG